MTAPTAYAHTHPEGNVGLRGEPTCPACRASGRTLTPEQTHVVGSLLDSILDLNLDGSEGTDAVRVALIEAVLQGATQQRIVDRRTVEAAAQRYEADVRNLVRLAASRYEDDPADSLGLNAQQLAEAHRAAERARALRGVTL